MEKWKLKDPENFFAHVLHGPSMVDISFSESDIQAACAELRASSATSADGVPSVLLTLIN